VVFRPAARRADRGKKKDWAGLEAVARVNQKGPETAFLGALMPSSSGKKVACKYRVVCEGEEEIGSTHFPEVCPPTHGHCCVKKCMGVFIPEAGQDADGGNVRYH